MCNVQRYAVFFTQVCLSLLNQFHLKSFLLDLVNNSFFFDIFFIKGGIIGILDELGINLDNLDPEDLDLLIELIKKIINSGLDLSSITFLFLFLSLLYIIAYQLTPDRKTIELDLVPIRIKIVNFYYKGIIDLNDPTGLRLKTLYA